MTVKRCCEYKSASVADVDGSQRYHHPDAAALSLRTDHSATAAGMMSAPRPPLPRPVSAPVPRSNLYHSTATSTTSVMTLLLPHGTRQTSRFFVSVCLSVLLLGGAVSGSDGAKVTVGGVSRGGGADRDGPGLLAPSPANNGTEDCLDALRRALFPTPPNATTSPYWDATGKPTSSQLETVLLWLGNYDMCQSLPRGRYCLADLTLNPASILPHPPANQSSIVLRWGICALDVCNGSTIGDHIKDIITETLHLKAPVSVQEVAVNCANNLPYSAGFQAAIVVFASLLVLCLLGTTAELYHKYKLSHQPKLVYCIDTAGSHLVCPDGTPDETSPLIRPSTSTQASDSPTEEWNRPPDPERLRMGLRREPSRVVRFMQCFSLVSNLSGLLSTSSSQPSVPCLHSIRVLSAAWVILGHTFLSLGATALIDNAGAATAYSQRFSWQVVANTFLAGDTFFFLSGLLVAYVSLHHMEKKNGSLSIPRFYLHRYLRLTPALGAVTLFWMYIVPYLGSGPVWYTVQDRPSCYNYWWTSFLYIHNFYPIHFADICMRWTWYLALDMQFYLASPIILHCIYRSIKKGLSLVLSLACLSLITTAALIGYFKIDVNLTRSIINDNESAMDDYQSIMFGKPYVRVPPYLVGMVMGYVLHWESPGTRTLSKVTCVLGWFISTLTVSCLVYGLYPTFQGHPLDLAGNIVYGTLSHVTWAVAVAWIVYACHHGYAGVFGDMLSWRGWVPLSRLTFSAYLIHPILLAVYNASAKSAVHLTDYYVSAQFCGMLLLAYAGSLYVTVTVERPVLSVERLLVGGRQTSLRR